MNNQEIDSVSQLFELAMGVQEDFLKKGPYPNLTLSETHVLEAVSKEQFPTMTTIASRLDVTLGTLTTSTKKIIEKGYLTREHSKEDGRIVILQLTEKGKKALATHDQFHKQLAAIYDSRIPKERKEWVYQTLLLIYKDIKIWKDKIESE
ncbi:MAG: MarR family transcriptional regulator [Thomasclavelia sp.]|nr:MarR family transcriptional regulator [Thomasclavelia sp.]